MDKHICKAKRVDTGQWVYGYYVAVPEEYGNGEIIHSIFDPNKCEHICMGEYKDFGWYEVDPDTVCRCTEIQDKNQKWIFENDIIQDEYQRIQIVSWGTDSIYPFIAFPEYKCWNKDLCEVIGNKFDNTELMGE